MLLEYYKFSVILYFYFYIRIQNLHKFKDYSSI